MTSKIAGRTLDPIQLPEPGSYVEPVAWFHGHALLTGDLVGPACHVQPVRISTQGSHIPFLGCDRRDFGFMLALDHHC